MKCELIERRWRRNRKDRKYYEPGVSNQTTPSSTIFDPGSQGPNKSGSVIVLESTVDVATSLLPP